MESLESSIELSTTQFKYVEQPTTFSVNLYPHQLKSIYDMECREKYKKIVPQAAQHTEIDTSVSIFADITGYGKTASIIGLIIRDKMEWNKDEFYIHKSYITHYGGGLILATENKKYQKINCNLILAGQSLIRQWEKELSATQLNYCSITTKKQITSCNVNDYDIIIVSPTMYNIFISHNNNSDFPIAWKRFIFDEPSHTSISSMKMIVAGFYWFMTATPYFLLNRSRNRNNFIANLFHLYMHRDIFDALIIKNNDEFVRASYELPETQHTYYETHQPLYDIVKGIANEQITNMISGGDINGAVKLLGGQTTDNVIKLIKEKKGEELLAIEYKIELYTSRGDSTKEQKWRERKTLVNNQLETLQTRINQTLGESCTICSQKYSKPIMIEQCGHLFCGACILEWLKTKNTCPLCRYTITTKELIHICVESDHDPKETKKLLTKIQTIVSIIKNKPGGKFILFSQFDETFTKIRKCCTEENINYGEIAGKKETREKVINDFKQGRITVLFLNSINNGAGINLQEATDIILYHKMSTDIQTQILGRANRIGRKINLSVHHLI